MYRLLNILKDGYITNKRISGSGSINSNVGQAGTLDFFKIWSQTTSGSVPTIELSRILLKPDLSDLYEMTGSSLDISDPSFKCYLSVKDIYGGQTTPSNFTISLLPLTKEWDEGRGSDIKAFRDLDTSNWMTASYSSGTPVEWSISGANGIGTYPTTAGLDCWDRGNLGLGSISLESKQFFSRGDEDLYVDVTTVVSATIAGVLPDNGWRLSYSGSLETNENSYFVKRFASRHCLDSVLKPKLIVMYDDSLEDSGNRLLFGQNNTVRTYREGGGEYFNFFSGSTEITGSNCLKLNLIASKSYSYTTSSYQQNFSASISYTTSSFLYYSASFTGSQTSIGGNNKKGFYEASVNLNPFLTSSLDSFIGTEKSMGFDSYWTSLDGTVLYSSGAFLTFNRIEGKESIVSERNFVINVTNLKNEYVQDSSPCIFKVFVQDYNSELPALKLPTPRKSYIFKTIYWRIIKAFSKEVVIPFDDSATKLSSDGVNMYFTLFTKDLEPNEVYEIEFKIKENGANYNITNEGFRFKVIA